MKKAIFLFSLTAGLFTANAQMTKTAGATLNINLKPIQSLSVGQSVVDLDYITSDDYDSGVSKLQEDHLSISSTGSFQLLVKANAAALVTSSSQTETIALADISITASEGSSHIDDAVMNGLESLTEVDQALITSVTGGLNKKFDVTYGAGDDYVSKFLTGGTGSGSDTVYSVGVVYTLIAQ